MLSLHAAGVSAAPTGKSRTKEEGSQQGGPTGHGESSSVASREHEEKGAFCHGHRGRIRRQAVAPTRAAEVPAAASFVNSWRPLCIASWPSQRRRGRGPQQAAVAVTAGLKTKLAKARSARARIVLKAKGRSSFPWLGTSYS